ncbi:MAG: prepilin-type N-terminal cleavage/methylation domain-containing protein [Nitrospiraceae bacterium]|nr:prepilin-type N-terminal cleavage/methylation domain-containing protein [Nitrospiraceae bacterium]
MLARSDGVGLIELVVVLAIIAVLAASALSFNGWIDKYRAESQVKQLYSDLMRAREQAVTGKRMYFIRMANNTYNIFVDNAPAPDGDNALNAPGFPDTRLKRVALSNQLTMESDLAWIDIDSEGLLSGATYIHLKSLTAPELNCVVLAPTRISLGSWDGANCVPN